MLMYERGTNHAFILSFASRAKGITSNACVREGMASAHDDDHIMTI